MSANEALAARLRASAVGLRTLQQSKHCMYEFDTEIHALEAGAAALEAKRAAMAVPMDDGRIDAIADLIVKGMPDGIKGFCTTWGWRQFARALLDDCAGYYREAGAAEARSAA